MLTAEEEAGGVALAEEGETLVEEVFGAAEGAGEWGSGEVALGGPGEVVVPDVFEGVIEADALEAVVEPDGPALLAGESGKGGLGEVLEAGDLVGAAGGGIKRWWEGHTSQHSEMRAVSSAMVQACKCQAGRKKSERLGGT